MLIREHKERSIMSSSLKVQVFLINGELHAPGQMTLI